MPADPTDLTLRPDGRATEQLREVRITRGWLDHAEGSVLVEYGRTRVLCAASFTEGVPRWRKGSGEGWVTAEYAMLPRATNTRSDRESVKGRIGGGPPLNSRPIRRPLRAYVHTPGRRGKAAPVGRVAPPRGAGGLEGGGRGAGPTGSSRPIARWPRACVDTGALGETPAVLDCAALQADGGTRTAAITGASVALADAVAWGRGKGLVKPSAA